MYNQIPYPETKVGYERLVNRSFALKRSVMVTEGMKGLNWFYWMQTLASSQTLASAMVRNTVELEWLEHLWDYENLFETAIVRANKG